MKGRPYLAWVLVFMAGPAFAPAPGAGPQPQWPPLGPPPPPGVVEDHRPYGDKDPIPDFHKVDSEEETRDAKLIGEPDRLRDFPVASAIKDRDDLDKVSKLLAQTPPLICGGKEDGLTSGYPTVLKNVSAFVRRKGDEFAVQDYDAQAARALDVCKKDLECFDDVIARFPASQSAEKAALFIASFMRDSGYELQMKAYLNVYRGQHQARTGKKITAEDESKLAQGFGPAKRGKRESVSTAAHAFFRRWLVRSGRYDPEGLWKSYFGEAFPGSKTLVGELKKKLGGIQNQLFPKQVQAIQCPSGPIRDANLSPCDFVKTLLSPPPIIAEVGGRFHEKWPELTKTLNDRVHDLPPPYRQALFDVFFPQVKKHLLGPSKEGISMMSTYLNDMGFSHPHLFEVYREMVKKNVAPFGPGPVNGQVPNQFFNVVVAAMSNHSDEGKQLLADVQQRYREQGGDPVHLAMVKNVALTRISPTPEQFVGALDDSVQVNPFTLQRKYENALDALAFAMKMDKSHSLKKSLEDWTAAAPEARKMLGEELIERAKGLNKDATFTPDGFMFGPAIATTAAPC